MLGQSNTNTIATYIKIENEDITVTQNGVYEAGEEYTGLGTVTVQVDSVNNQDKTVDPTTSEQIVIPDQGYTGLSSVTVGAVTNAIDNNIQAGNIKSGVNILGITGNVVELNATPTTVTPTTSEQTITPQGAYNGFSTITVDPVTSSIDSNITPSNIVNGVTILGVQGTATALNGETITVTPTTSQQVITPTSPHNGITEVTVDGVTSSIDSNIAAGNIKSGVSILGVNGTVTELNGTILNVTPTASSQSHTPSAPNNAYTQVTVDGDVNLVAGNIVKDVTIFGVTGSYEGQVINNQNITIQPSTTQEMYTADVGYTGLGTVTAAPVTSSIDNNIQAGNIKSGVSILGVTGTVEESPIKEWYNWRTESSLGTWSESTLPISESWNSIAYGDGKFVTLEGGTGSGDGYKSAYSTDGINWTSGRTLPYPCDWSSVAYGNGKFVAVQLGAYNQYYGDKAAYSTDGIRWTGTSMPASDNWSSVTYGNGKFVSIASGGSGGSNRCAYSTDGITWTQSSLPSSRGWKSVTYGDGKFVAIAYNSPGSYGTNLCAYSTDGVNWTESYLSTVGYWWSITYGNGKFVAIGENDCAAYSIDGINWTSITMPYSPSKKWKTIAYGSGKFIAIESPGSYSSSTPPNVVAYSTDGVNWTSMSMPSIAFWFSIAYGDDKFVAVASQSDKSAYVPLTFLKVFTDTLSPTTASTVYSVPFTASSLTITSVGNETIVCSDSNVYTRNSTGDEDSVMNITQNGTYNVTQYVGAVVNVEDIPAVIESLSITPTTSAQTITPTTGVDGYSPITVSAVDSSIDNNIVAGNIRDGVTILGITGDYEGTVINNQNKNATVDGTYVADSGYTGLGEVVVTAGAVVAADIEAQLHEINSGSIEEESGEEPPL